MQGMFNKLSAYAALIGVIGAIGVALWHGVSLIIV